MEFSGQEVRTGRASASCRSHRKSGSLAPMQAELQSPVEPAMPTIARKKRSSQPAQRAVICTHCNEVTEVSPRAMSVFCPHCKKRLVLEDYTITTYHGVRMLATCGDVVIEKRGHMSAAVKADSMTIKGKMQGSVVARRTVVIHRTANCQSDIESPTLVIEGGAVLNGFVRIGNVEADLALEAASPEGAESVDAETPPSGAVETAIKPGTRASQKVAPKKVVRKKVVRKKKVRRPPSEN